MKLKLIPIRLSGEKYRLIRHRLVDQDISFQKLVEALIDQHFLNDQATPRPGSRRDRRVVGGAETVR